MLSFKQFWEAIEHFLTAEWILTQSSNGGGVILFRSLWTMSLIYLIGLASYNWLDPARSYDLSWIELRKQVIGSGEWIAGIFAGVYTAFYARFASQWAYLAGVYNQIKSAQSRRDHDEGTVAEWKYGFIEDARELHLALKPMFAGIIREWLREEKVKARFEEQSGTSAMNDLVTRLEAVLRTRSH